MKLLLDTHIALWWVNKHEKLSPKAETMLLDSANTLHISMASAWEVAIKTSVGKLYEFEGGVKAFLAKIDAIPVDLLPITPQYLAMVETLPFHHRDPFDRLLIATAITENMTILTADENIPKYDVPSAW
jgi:PIN domain nuclease of toxin-antitoxin system